MLSKEQTENNNANIVFSFPIKFLAALPPRGKTIEDCRRSPSALFNLFNNLDRPYFPLLSHFLVIRFGSGKNNSRGVKRDTYRLTGTAALMGGAAEVGKSQILGQIALQKGLTIRGRRTNRD